MADDVQPVIVVPMGAAPAEPEPRKGGCLRSCAIALIVFVGVLAFSGACAWFAFDAIDRSLTQERLESLSEREALAALNSAGLEPPDLSQYAYVTADGLQGPRFTDVTIGDTVMRSSLFAALLTNDNAVQLEDPFLSYRVVSAFATWRSSAIEVRRFVVQRFVFDLDKNTWQTTTSELGAPTVTPVRAPNVRSFQEGLIPLLRFYDSRLAEAFADATVRVTSESLTAQGGTFEASLEKGSAVCTVTYEVQWSEADGWILSVKEVDSSRAGRLPAATVPVAITPQPLAGGGQDQPAQQMVCHAGDLVKLTGTLSLRENQFLLNTAYMQVQLNGRTYKVKSFVVNAPSNTLSSLIGQSVSLEGYISAANAFEDAPLSIMYSAMA